MRTELRPGLELTEWVFEIARVPREKVRVLGARPIADRRPEEQAGTRLRLYCLPSGLNRDPRAATETPLGNPPRA